VICAFVGGVRMVKIFLISTSSIYPLLECYNKKGLVYQNLRQTSLTFEDYWTDSDQTSL